MMLSAARSWIFNRIVSGRIDNGLFNQVLEGDLLQVDAGLELVSKATFEQGQCAVTNREAQITAAMAGDNALPTQAQALDLEQPYLDAEPDLMALIRGNRMRHERRPIALKAQDLSWRVEGQNVTLDFSLDSGCFATAIVRELIEEIDVERVY